jgi:hypothetical protein
VLTRIARRHRCVTAPGGDAGISLIELVVAMSLTTIVSAMALAFFVTVNSASSRTVDTSIDTAGARNVLQSWSTLLDLADSPTQAGGTDRFVQITPTSAIFYANANDNRATGGGIRTAPAKIALSLESGQLVERSYLPQSSVVPSTYPSTASTVRYLVSGVTTPSAWLFTPYVAGSPPTLSEPRDCATGTAGLCAGNSNADTILASVVRVDIAFTVSTTDGDSQAFSSSAVITGDAT